MAGTNDSTRNRRGAVAIVVILAVILLAVAGIAFATSRGPAAGPSRAASQSTAPVVSATQPSSVPSVSATPLKTTAPSAGPTAAAPQPTRTSTISSAAPIVKELTARVAKVEAVRGEAQAPGEVAGPSVRFTITITNSTDASVDLTNTVVNAYYGSQATPATELAEPGGRPFPASVGAGRSTTGVFVFNIPAAQREQVKVTVDTSVQNPVVAFVGRAPR